MDLFFLKRLLERKNFQKTGKKPPNGGFV